jgi:hypothetical protein
MFSVESTGPNSTTMSAYWMCWEPSRELQFEHRGCRRASLAAELTVTVLPVRRASLALHTYAVSPSFEAAS